MNRNRLGVIALMLIVALSAAAALKDTVEKDFKARGADKSVKSIVSTVAKMKMTADEELAMKFLYSYMPLPDMTDYSVDFYKMNVDYALRTRKEMTWGSKIPDREFYHFVLPVRINNENLDESRKVFFEELKDRVNGMSMSEAALEVNHWCHEKVSYRPSDSRTSSPLASVKTAFGRCGEESTFAVAAMRSVGIPARQVYTPRWAHTDDNHAWVEVWIDGKWQFLGACEPEAVLNLGWFNAPASRGMMMHTKAFGHYDGPEDVMSKSNCYTEINVTENYAPTAKCVVRVVDEKGAPVSAQVDFKVYNYAELYTVCRKTSDANGYTYVTSGLGDLVAWASKGDKFGFEKCSVGRQDTVVVTLNKGKGFTGVAELDLVPPVERNTVPPMTQEQIDNNQKRFLHEDSLRAAYEATMVSDAKAREMAKVWGLPEDKVAHLLVGSRGNHDTLVKFIDGASNKQRAISLLEVISDKDLRDVKLEVLTDHFYNTPDNGDNSKFYFEYVMNPRIDNEMIEPYKAYLQKALKKLDVKAFKADPYKWADWVKNNITVIADWNPQSLRMMPTKVMQYRCSDAESRDMFFVAGARAMGIYARKDMVAGKVQWASKEGEWHDVQFANVEKQTNAPQGDLKLNFVPSGRMDAPKYYYHFTLQKIDGGVPMLLGYPDDAYEMIFKKGNSKIDTGDYVLTSGTRLGDGSVLCRLSFFAVNEGKETDTDLVFRTSETDVQVIGNFNSEDKYYDLKAKQEKSLLSTTGRGYYILGVINPNHEPSNHALHDIEACKAEFEKWGQKMVLLFADEAASKRHKWAEFKNMPNTVVYGTDLKDAIANELKTALNLETDNRPIFVIADTFNRVVFVSQGYTIGLGEQMMKVIDKLNEKK